jgi:cation diffusion facilitator CzcD-associated flavoprotein CzcO
MKCLASRLCYGTVTYSSVSYGSVTTSLPGFPNFFMLLGPNTGLGHGSMVYMIESQIEHALTARHPAVVAG